MTRVAVFGLGHVGQALLKSFRRLPGARLVLAADHQGAMLGDDLDPAAVVARKSRRDYDAPRRPGDAVTLLERTRPDVHVELTPTDLETGQPSEAHIHAALDRGVAVVTATKSHQRSLAALQATLARAGRTPFLDHAATLAGIPATEMAAGMGLEVTRIEGVLNGTTNFILKRLAEGAAFQTALDEAIARGFAERNWRYDLEGQDVAVKLVGLARHLMGVLTGAADATLQGHPDPALGLSRGIVGVTPELVARLASEGKKLKLVGEVTRGQDGARARVGPRVLSTLDPLAQVDGFQNVVRIEGLMNGTRMELVLRGPGAGADETASRVLGNVRHVLSLLALR